MRARSPSSAAAAACSFWCSGGMERIRSIAACRGGSALNLALGRPWLAEALDEAAPHLELS